MMSLVLLQSILYIFMSTTSVTGQTYNSSAYEITTIEAIEREGYTAEEHTVITEDGYILKFHRIPGNASSTPVFLQHGMLGSSYQWFMPEKESSLAMFLADQGYDVWMGNGRGNVYARNHTKYDPSEPRFWEFSWHEIGVYDVPAMITYISDIKNESVICIGVSMGTTIFFVMGAERPEMANKVKAFFALGPVAFLRHSKSLVRLVSPFASFIKKMLDDLGIYELFPPNIKELVKIFLKSLCFSKQIENNDHICARIFIALAEDSPKRFNYKLLPKILSHATEGTSIQVPIHYMQLLRDGDFKRYDYGVMKNLKIYNSYTPPAYNLSKNKIPIGLFWAEKDKSFNNVLDIEKLYNSIPNKLFNYKVPNPLFSHFDFGLGIDIAEYVYKKLLFEMQKFR